MQSQVKRERFCIEAQVSYVRMYVLNALNMSRRTPKNRKPSQKLATVLMGHFFSTWNSAKEPNRNGECFVIRTKKVIFVFFRP